MNFYKSKSRFSKGMSNSDKREIEQVLQLKSSTSVGAYLGCNGMKGLTQWRVILMRSNDSCDRNRQTGKLKLCQSLVSLF